MADESYHSCRGSTTDEEQFVTASNSPHASAEVTLGDACASLLADSLAESCLVELSQPAGAFRPLASSSRASLRGLHEVMRDLRQLAASDADRPAEFRIGSDSFLSVSTRCHGQQRPAVYVDNELVPYRPAARRTRSYPLGRLPLLPAADSADAGSSPSLEKRVRFADAIGLDLESVVFIASRDEAGARWQPPLPTAATASAQSTETSAGRWEPQFAPRPLDARTLAQQQQQQQQHVSLESVRIDCPALEATVRVRNLAPEKTVSLRLTFDDWLSYRDLGLRFLESLPQLGQDRFGIRTYLPQEAAAATRIEFALHYSVCGQQFWDNNSGKNFVFLRQ